MNYLTEEEAKMPLDFALMQLVLGIQGCKIKKDVIEILKDAVELGKMIEQGNQEAVKQ